MRILKPLLMRSLVLRQFLTKIYQFYIGIQGILGVQLLQLVPAKAVKIQNESFSFVQGQRRNWLDALLRAGLIKQAHRASDPSHLEKYHLNFWQGKGGTDYHHTQKQLFSQVFLAHHAYIADEISTVVRSNPGFTQLVEFGSGSGLVLNYLAENIPEIQQFTGVDLSAETSLQNSANFTHPNLKFVASDALTWLEEYGQPKSIFLTHNGVLEYFSQDKVESLLRFINERCSPAVFIAIESVSIDHNLTNEFHSKPLGKEYSFSHNYPDLFEKYGFELKHMKPSFEKVSHSVYVFIATSGVE